MTLTSGRLSPYCENNQASIVRVLCFLLFFCFFFLLFYNHYNFISLCLLLFVGTVTDKILSHVSKLVRSHTSTQLGHRWPSSLRTLRRRVQKKCGWFWDHCSYSYCIDLSRFGLSVTNVEFTCVDPVFVWLQQCKKLIRAGKELKFHAKILQDQSGHELYGSGVQYGLLMRAANYSIPRNGVAALMNLSWDKGDTSYQARGACPICLQVMNTNCGSDKAVGCVGYLPSLDVSAVAKTTQAFQDASRYLLQTCIGKILSLIEVHAQHGFKGRYLHSNIYLFLKHTFASMTSYFYLKFTFSMHI